MVSIININGRWHHGRSNIRRASRLATVERCPMKTRKHSSLARQVLGMLAVSLLAAPTAANAWTCTPVSDDLATTTTLTRVDPIEQLAAGIISGDFCLDLELIAEQEGITFEEAIERYAWQEAFGYLVNNIQEKFPEEYAGSWIEDDVNGFVSFTGTAPPEAVEVIRAFPHPHAIQIIENRVFTQATLTKRLHVVHDIAASYEEVADIVSTYSITTGQIGTFVESAQKVTSHYFLLGSWSTHWFRCEMQIPEEWTGKHVHFRWDSNSEAMVNA